MSDLKVTGKLIKKLDPVTGDGKNGTWKKQEFVINDGGEYPKDICIEVWGDKVEELEKIDVGAEITVHINIESREWKERWYTNAKAWRFEGASTGTGEDPKQETKEDNLNPGDDDLPF